MDSFQTKFHVFSTIFDDFLKTKKMRNVRTVILAAVSRRDLYYVSENESFCFGQKPWSGTARILARHGTEIFGTARIHQILARHGTGRPCKWDQKYSP